jgi:hypothetical protein
MSTATPAWIKGSPGCIALSDIAVGVFNGYRRLAQLPMRMGVSGDDSGLIRGDSETSPDDAKPSIFDHGGLRWRPVGQDKKDDKGHELSRWVSSGSAESQQWRCTSVVAYQGASRKSVTGQPGYRPSGSGWVRHMSCRRRCRVIIIMASRKRRSSSAAETRSSYFTTVWRKSALSPPRRLHLRAALRSAPRREPRPGPSRGHRDRPQHSGGDRGQP